MLRSSHQHVRLALKGVSYIVPLRRRVDTKLEAQFSLKTRAMFARFLRVGFVIT